ncbi:MAG: hypothetical protein IJO76_02985 [Clostridia bacterium]|nr:hypothetical protein [Clostridia bacterium]
MKRIICLLMAASLFVSLTACASEKAEKYCSECGNGIDKNASVCDECSAVVNGKTEKKETTSKKAKKTSKKTQKKKESTVASTTTTTTTTTTITATTTTTTEITTTTTEITTTTTTAKPTTTTQKPTTTIKTTTKPTTKSTTTIDATTMTTAVSTTTTTTTMPRTTRTATQQEIDMIVERIVNYYLPQFQNAQYQQQCVINDIRAEIDDLCYEQAVSTKKLQEQYANMGMLQSGAYERALQQMNDKYRRMIANLEEDLEYAQAQYDALEEEFNQTVEEEALKEIERFQLSTLS